MNFFNIALTLMLVLLPLNVYAEKIGSFEPSRISYHATNIKFGSKYSTYRRQIDQLTFQRPIEILNTNGDYIVFAVPKNLGEIENISLHGVDAESLTSEYSAYPSPNAEYAADYNYDEPELTIPMKTRLAQTAYAMDGSRASDLYCYADEIECLHSSELFTIPVVRGSEYDNFQIAVQYKTGDFKTSSTFHIY